MRKGSEATENSNFNSSFGMNFINCKMEFLQFHDHA